jgi:AbrB family looped-hinge helix DNA binding protein
MANYYTKLTRKGQMTVPADIRRELGLSEGDRITVTSESGVVTIRRAENVAERTAGIFHKYVKNHPFIGPDDEGEAWVQAAIERDRESMEP